MNYASSVTSFFFFNDTATTEIYTLSLHDALPISADAVGPQADRVLDQACQGGQRRDEGNRPVGEPLLLQVEQQVRQREPNPDRKSTRLNSSHLVISYAVFCLNKKKDQCPEVRAQD